MEKEKKLVFLLVISMLIWGVTWSSAKVLSNYGSAISIAYIRFWVTIMTLLPAIKLFKIDYNIKKSGWLNVIGAGICMAVYGLVFFKGLQNGLAGAGGVLVTTLNPIFSFMIGLVISRQLPKKYEGMGLGIGLLAGVVLLQVWENSSDIFASGNLYFVAAGFIWALMGKISSKGGKAGHPIAFSLWLQTTAAIGMTFFVDFNEVFTILKQGDTKFWLNMIWFSSINSAVATSCFFYATMSLGAEKTSTFVFLVPAGAVFSSWLFLDEPVMLHTILGGVLGILAVLVINKKKVENA
jgi:drug/metabolite transporter (DMT)-like permease